MARHSGKGKPGSNTKAALNDTYKDVLTGDIYICKSIYNAPFGPKEYSWSLVEEDDDEEEEVIEKSPSIDIPEEPVVEEPTPEEEPEEELEMIDLNAPTEPTRQEKPRNNYRKQYNKHYNKNNNK